MSASKENKDLELEYIDLEIASAEKCLLEMLDVYIKDVDEILKNKQLILSLNTTDQKLKKEFIKANKKLQNDSIAFEFSLKSKILKDKRNVKHEMIHSKNKSLLLKKKLTEYVDLIDKHNKAWDCCDEDEREYYDNNLNSFIKSIEEYVSLMFNEKMNKKKTDQLQQEKKTETTNIESIVEAAVQKALARARVFEKLELNEKKEVCIVDCPEVIPLPALKIDK